MKMIDPKLDSDLCTFICGWHRFEQRHDVEIIDMALSDKTPGKDYASRDEVLKDIEGFLAIPEIKSQDVIRRKLTAHHYFLRMTMGEDIPFDEYFENTMGTKPVLFSDAKIEAIKQQANAELAVVGLEVGPDMEARWKAIQDKLPFDRIPSFMDKAHVEFYRKINRKLKLDANFSVTYSTLPKGHSFLAWISGDGRDYKVELNEEHTTKYPVERLKTVAIHELSGHAPHFAIMRQSIEAKQRPRYLGFVTVHEPIQFAAEGLAATLDFFYPDEYGMTDIIPRIEQTVTRLFYVVVNNAYVHLARGGDFNECVNMLVHQAGIEKTPTEKQLRYILDNKPIGFGYRQVYSKTIEAFIEIAGSHPDKDAFIKSVYNGFLMPEDILAQTKRPIAEFV